MAVEQPCDVHPCCGSVYNIPKGLKRDLDQTDIFFIGGWLGGQVTIRERIQKINA